MLTVVLLTVVVLTVVLLTVVVLTDVVVESPHSNEPVIDISPALLNALAIVPQYLLRSLMAFWDSISVPPKLLGSKTNTCCRHVACPRLYITAFAKLLIAVVDSTQLLELVDVTKASSLLVSNPS